MDSRFLNSGIDLDSLVKAYAAILCRTNQATVPTQGTSTTHSFVGYTPTTSATEVPSSRVADITSALILKRSHEEDGKCAEDGEPDSKKQQTQGAFEPVYKSNVQPIIGNNQQSQPCGGPMNVCCSDTLLRYTSLIERELIGETVRGARQALFNAHNLWYSLYQPALSRQAVNKNIPATNQNHSLHHLNTLTSQVGQSCFSSIRNLAKQDEPSTKDSGLSAKTETNFVYSPISSGRNGGDPTSRGASIRKRKCKVTDIMAESPPSKIMATNASGIQNNGIFPEFSIDHFTTSTLTSAHLRKAKLLFLYSRYPSSAIVKDFFPDVNFNKGNTAQLVKWFSNFREYFYIQVEKFARQFASDPSIRVDDISTDKCGDLLKNLKIHYNRSNRIEMPQNFVHVVAVALKEFFIAVRSGIDNDCSWKKAIYKIISRLDVDIPNDMKYPDF